MNPSVRFEPGAFYGHYAARRRAGDVQLAEMRPTVPEYDVRLHTHDDAHLVLVPSGEYVSSAIGMPRVAVGPVLVMNPPGTEHRDRFAQLAGSFLTLSFPRTVWQQYSEVARLPADATRLSDAAVAHAMLLLGELRRWDSSSALVVQGGLTELIDDARGLWTERHGDGPAWLARAQARLAEDCTNTPPLAELARLADVHPVYFSRAFRKRYGCSPGVYLRRRRLQRATALLHRRREMSLADIAADVGYVDQAHFSRAFQQAFGTTPGRYRKLL